MRLPKLRQLTEAQKQVYLYAPTDRHTLVSGPPGTGKTLIACLRAVEMQKKRVPVVLCMFSSVLAQYSSNAGHDGDTAIDSTTVFKWFQRWWTHSGIPPHQTAKNVFIEISYADRQSVKGTGARWDANEWSPWRHTKKGVWTVDGPKYHANPDVFSRWRVSDRPPVIDDDPYKIDWKAVSQHVFEHEEALALSSLELGTMLIDEGQDFAPGFYGTLRTISQIAAGREGVRAPLRCLVLADENQQITDDNSKLDDIVKELKIAEVNRYSLSDNFRNSREIAELAVQFFADVGNRPLLPDRTAERPVYSQVAGRQEAISRIVTWVRNNPGREVGVLVFDETTRAFMTDALDEILSKVQGRSIRVQSYSNATRDTRRADKLVFDSGDVVTVLNMQSCKGLEFDAAFIIDPYKAKIGLYGLDRYKMQMFVAVSRAREWVHLIDCDMAAATAPHQACMPDKRYLRRDGHDDEDSPVTSSRRPDAEPRVSNGLVETVETAKQDWEREIVRLVKKYGLVTTDMRNKGGALWVTANRDLASELEPLGFAFSEGRSAWWRR